MNRQLNILISNSKQQVDDFVGELTFSDYSTDMFYEMNLIRPDCTVHWVPRVPDRQPTVQRGASYSRCRHTY